MGSPAVDVLGWAATAIFVASYFCARPAVLRAVQMLGAAMWVTYGAIIGAWPVMVANVLVFSAAAWTAARKSPALPST
jgi:Bacterial inner membrane protein